MLFGTASLAFFHLKLFYSFFLNYIYTNYKSTTKQKLMLHFPKVIWLRQIRNKGLINYCENAAYFNTSPGLSIKERKKKEQYTYKQQQQ